MREDETADAPVLYELWSEAVEAPPRSRLYGLKPIGIGTAEVESLTGYINRLADAHLVTATRLLKHELLPRVREEKSLDEGQIAIGEVWLRRYTIDSMGRRINGLSLTTERWIKALESLTGQSKLRFLTLLDWKGALFNQKLLSAFPRWCPACFEDWRSAGQPIYEPLIWRLYPVTICLKHQRRLQSQCERCFRQAMTFSARSRPGYCSTCGHWMGASSHNEKHSAKGLSQEELEWQNWVASNLGELLAASPTLASPPPKNAIARFIAHNLAMRPGVTPTAFGRELGVGHSVIGVWLRDEYTMHIESLLKICSRLGVSLLQAITGVDLLSNGVCAARPVEKPDSIEIRKHWLPTEANLEILRQEMVSALETEFPYPSLRAIARRLKMAPRSLLRHEPGLWRQIVDRRSAYYTEINVRIRQALEESLQECPAPTLDALAERHGFERSRAWKYCPELCREVVARHISYRRQIWMEVRRQMESALREETPPPTIQSLAARLNHCASSLRSYFPDLCHEIAARRREYERDCCKRRQEQLLEEVRETVLKLHAQGIFPSVNQVSIHLPRPRDLGANKQVVATIAKIRKELGCE
jgi:hypothetical protein